MQAFDYHPSGDTAFDRILYLHEQGHVFPPGSYYADFLAQVEAAQAIWNGGMTGNYFYISISSRRS